MSPSVSVKIIAAACLVTACAHGSRRQRETPQLDSIKIGKIGVVIPATAPNDGSGWGESVSAPDQEAIVRRALAATEAGGDTVLEMMSRSVVLGPALWQALRQMDPDLVDEGLSMESHVPAGGGRTQRLQMRAFRAGDRREMIDSPAFRTLARTFARGTPRPATMTERQLFYAVISFDLTGKPLTVVEHQDQRLVLQLVDGRLFWIDLLSGYEQVGGATSQ